MMFETISSIIVVMVVVSIGFALFQKSQIMWYNHKYRIPEDETEVHLDIEVEVRLNRIGRRSLSLGVPDGLAQSYLGGDPNAQAAIKYQAVERMRAYLPMPIWSRLRIKMIDTEILECRKATILDFDKK